MSQRIQRQAETFAESPHVAGHPPRLEDLPDSAYHQPTHQPHDRGDFNERTHRFDADPYETNTPDEISGYNWGPPPNPNHLHDPGFREAEVDTYPFE